MNLKLLTGVLFILTQVKFGVCQISVKCKKDSVEIFLPLNSLSISEQVQYLTKVNGYVSKATASQQRHRNRDQSRDQTNCSANLIENRDEDPDAIYFSGHFNFTSCGGQFSGNRRKFRSFDHSTPILYPPSPLRPITASCGCATGGDICDGVLFRSNSATKREVRFRNRGRNILASPSFISPALNSSNLSNEEEAGQFVNAFVSQVTTTSNFSTPNVSAADLETNESESKQQPQDISSHNNTDKLHLNENIKAPTHDDHNAIRISFDTELRGVPTGYAVPNFCSISFDNDNVQFVVVRDGCPTSSSWEMKIDAVESLDLPESNTTLNRLILSFDITRALIATRVMQSASPVAGNVNVNMKCDMHVYDLGSNTNASSFININSLCFTNSSRPSPSDQSSVNHLSYDDDISSSSSSSSSSPSSPRENQPPKQQIETLQKEATFVAELMSDINDIDQQSVFNATAVRAAMLLKQISSDRNSDGSTEWLQSIRTKWLEEEASSAAEELLELRRRETDNESLLVAPEQQQHSRHRKYMKQNKPPIERSVVHRCLYKENFSHKIVGFGQKSTRLQISTACDRPTGNMHTGVVHAHDIKKQAAAEKRLDAEITGLLRKVISSTKIAQTTEQTALMDFKTSRNDDVVASNPLEIRRLLAVEGREQSLFSSEKNQRLGKNMSPSIFGADENRSASGLPLNTRQNIRTLSSSSSEIITTIKQRNLILSNFLSLILASVPVLQHSILRNSFLHRSSRTTLPPGRRSLRRLSAAAVDLVPDEKRTDPEFRLRDYLLPPEIVESMTQEARYIDTDEMKHTETDEIKHTETDEIKHSETDVADITDIQVPGDMSVSQQNDNKIVQMFLRGVTSAGLIPPLVLDTNSPLLSSDGPEGTTAASENTLLLSNVTAKENNGSQSESVSLGADDDDDVKTIETHLVKPSGYDVPNTNSVVVLTSNRDRQRTNRGFAGLGIGQNVPVSESSLYRVVNQFAYGPWTAEGGRNKVDRTSSGELGNSLGFYHHAVSSVQKVMDVTTGWRQLLASSSYNEIRQEMGNSLAIGNYGVHVDRSQSFGATAVEILARGFLSGTVVDFVDKSVGQRFKIRDFEISILHDFDNYFFLSDPGFGTEIMTRYRGFSTVVANDIAEKRFGVTVGLRGYNFALLHDFDQYLTVAQATWRRGWQLAYESDFADEYSTANFVSFGAGKLNRLYAQLGVGVGDDGVPQASARVQTRNMGLGVDFLNEFGERILQYSITVGRATYVWQSSIELLNVYIPNLFGVKVEDLERFVLSFLPKRSNTRDE